MTELAKKVNDIIEPYHPLEDGNEGLHPFSRDFFNDVDDSLDDEYFDNAQLSSICYTINTLIDIMDKNIPDYKYWNEIYGKLKALLPEITEK